MNKLQASMRDKSARTWRERRLYYRVGSCFKGCSNCGSVAVYRTYYPKDLGWTYKCWECSASDLNCWECDPEVIGTEPVIKTRTAMAELRRQERLEKAAEVRKEKNQVPLDQRVALQQKIAALEARIAEMSKGR